MARTKGSRNADYDEQRLGLARRLRGVVMGPKGVRASLRELAQAAGVGVATLTHYFGDREGVLRAVLETFSVDGAPHLAVAARPIAGDPRASLTELLGRLVDGWTNFGVGDVQGSALAIGLTGPSLGPAYVNLVLEPLLQAGEQRLRAHVELGDLAPMNERFAAIELLSPVVLGLLHQSNLLGQRCRPLDVEAFVRDVVERFLASHPPPKTRRQPSRRQGVTRP